MNVESISFARPTGGDTESGGTRACDGASAPAAQTDGAQQARTLAGSTAAPAARAAPVAPAAPAAPAASAASAAPVAPADVTVAPTGKAGAEQAPGAQPVKDRAFTASDSPCVAICSTLFDDICRGCGRTAMEVSNWVFMTEEEKKVVWTRILAQGYPRR